ncbi:MAG: hypothetical protein WAZ94_00255 [Phycisphaerales bacterium]
MGEVGSLLVGIGAYTSCRGIDASLSHPLLVRLSGVTPALLPLDPGRLTCLTCHDRDKARGHEAGTASAAAFLRGTEPAGGLCVRCHTAGPEAAAAHAAGLGRAHLSRGSRRAGPHPGGRLDAESTGGVGCHDGSTASGAGGHAMSVSPGAGPTDYPIGALVSAKSTREDCTIRTPHAIDPASGCTTTP